MATGKRRELRPTRNDIYKRLEDVKQKRKFWQVYKEIKNTKDKIYATRKNIGNEYGDRDRNMGGENW